VQFNIRLQADVRNEVVRLSKRLGLSANSIVRAALNDYLHKLAALEREV
jgi:predicted HicB family RNase H-like nuclease